MEVRRVSKEEERLLDYLRNLNFGEVVIEVKSGRPVMIKLARQDIKLTD